MDYEIIEDCDLVFDCNAMRRRKIVKTIATATAWWSGYCKMAIPKGVRLSGNASDIYDIDNDKRIITGEIVSVEQVPPSMIDIHLSHKIYQTQKEKAMKIIHRLTCPGFLFTTSSGGKYLMPLQPGDKADWVEPTDSLMTDMVNRLYRKRGA